MKMSMSAFCKARGFKSSNDGMVVNPEKANYSLRNRLRTTDFTETDAYCLDSKDRKGLCFYGQ